MPRSSANRSSAKRPRAIATYPAHGSRSFLLIAGLIIAVILGYGLWMRLTPAPSVDINNTATFQGTTVVPKTSETEEPTEPLDPKDFPDGKVPVDVPIEYVKAFNEAKSYLRVFPMSKAELFKQLNSEYGSGFTEEASQWAVDHIHADWRSNAVKAALEYANNYPYSYHHIKELLGEHYLGFTEPEVAYAMQFVNVDFNKKALKKAQELREINMTNDEIYAILTDETGEAFTKEEAQYAMDHLGD